VPFALVAGIGLERDGADRQVAAMASKAAAVMAMRIMAACFHDARRLGISPSRKPLSTVSPALARRTDGNAGRAAAAA